MTFTLSMFASAFGMTKFLLNGPLHFLPKDSLLSGMVSIPFITQLLLNTMFGVRVFALEAIFFSNYISTFPPNDFNFNDPDDNLQLLQGNYTTKIEPIIAPEYRLVVYLLPGILAMLANGIRLAFTIKGFGKFFLKFPQFIVSPCFSPIMFEGVKINSLENKYSIRIWKLGSVLNAGFLGFSPKLYLLFLT